MEIMQEEKSSRKKLLVPLVVLMLCAVSLAGAAYAYSSTLTNTGNTADVHFISVDKNEGSTQLVTLSGNAVLEFTDNYTYAENTKTGNVIKYELNDDVLVATYYLYIDTDEAQKSVTFSVGSNAFDTMKFFTVGETTTYMDTVYAMKYSVTGAQTGTVNGTVNVPVGTTNTVTVKTEELLTVTVTFDLIGSTSAGTIETINYADTSSTPSSNTAETYYNAFVGSDNNKFDLVFKAVSA